MSDKKELSELRAKDPKALVAELDRERVLRTKDIIAVKLGKQSKIHEVKSRKQRIARILTILSEKR